MSGVFLYSVNFFFFVTIKLNKVTKKTYFVTSVVTKDPHIGHSNSFDNFGALCVEKLQTGDNMHTRCSALVASAEQKASNCP